MAGAANPATTQPNVFSQASKGLTNAMSGAQQAINFQPASVNTRFGYSPGTVRSQQAFGGMSQYFNPYTQQVIDPAMADLERQRQMQMGDIGAQATAARAFGGSRHGVTEALTNEAFARQGGQLSSGLRLQGFNTALGASQQDVANAMQASLANQAAQARAAEFAQQSQLQAEMANQQAQAQAQAQQIAAAGQLGNLAQTGFGMGMGITQQQMQQGGLQQMLQQQLIDAAKAQYGGFTGAPQASLGLPMTAVGAANMGQNTQTTSQKPGLFNYLALLASM